MFLFRVSTVACFLLDPILYLEVGILSKDLWDEESSCYLEGDGGNKCQLMTLHFPRIGDCCLLRHHVFRYSGHFDSADTTSTSLSPLMSRIRWSLGVSSQHRPLRSLCDMLHLVYMELLEMCFYSSVCLLYVTHRSGTRNGILSA